jgi:hypothetical protein
MSTKEQIYRSEQHIKEDCSRCRKSRRGGFLISLVVASFLGLIGLSTNADLALIAFNLVFCVMYGWQTFLALGRCNHRVCVKHLSQFFSAALLGTISVALYLYICDTEPVRILAMSGIVPAVVLVVFNFYINQRIIKFTSE